MDFDQTWYILCPLENLEPYWFSRSRSPGQFFWTIQYAHCHCKFSYMINQKFMNLCTLQDPNMKMCTLVGYPSPLSFTPVMLLWTYFERIQFALSHCKFSYMINQKFMKLCTLQDPNMKMCTLVGYPSPLRFTPVMLFWTSKFWDNSPCALSSQLLPHCLMRCLWSLVYCENLIWRCAH